MKILEERAGMAAVLLLTAAVVIALAVLQYRSNTEASDATGVRLADALQLSMINWHLDLFRNLSEVCLTIRMTAESSPDIARQLSERLAEWRSIARYPDLVAHVYVVVATRANAPLETYHLQPETGQLASVAWPAVLGSLGPELALARTAASIGEGEAPPQGQLTESFYNIGSALRNWRFAPAVPALIRPMDSQERTPGDRAAAPSASQWIVIQLNEDVLRNRILPDLAHRYFQGTDGLDYEVAVVDGVAPSRTIYSSDPGFGDQPVADADGRMDIFGRGRDRDSPLAIDVFHRTSENSGPTAAMGINWFPLLTETPPVEDWQLVVRHRRGGPLGAFVADMRRRGLAMSFGALCLLVLSMSMLVITSVRAQRLAGLQMDFVTTVSHELRTPLTIIGSAADNIANGVVEGRPQLQEYGSIIGNEVARLSGLVERILLFASMRETKPRYVMQALAPAEIIDAVLASTGGLIQAAQFTIERDTPADLPAVTGDLMAVSQCVENLITNALKYGKDQRWIGIRARVADGGKSGRQVQISVSDRGIGVRPEDLPHIFEPFYRSTAVRLAQIHGTGLGLALAQQVAESMGGSLTVVSTPGLGSTFTLCLRCADPGAIQGTLRSASSVHAQSFEG